MTRMATIRCPYCSTAIAEGERRCPSCGAGAPIPPTAAERALGVVMPRLRFGWLAALCMAVSAAIGGLGYVLSPEPPFALKLVALVWVVPALPVLLFWTAIRQARALGRGMGAGILLSIFLILTGFMLVFGPLAEADPPGPDPAAPAEPGD
ncbi:MAG: hypothetical protein D6754_03150 [Alphaproteobacteria bacterium]|nr:MAG: hypothetical protein D6754_03150 [Alphaproteobacteria bacterium]